MYRMEGVCRIENLCWGEYWSQGVEGEEMVLWGCYEAYFRRVWMCTGVLCGKCWERYLQKKKIFGCVVSTVNVFRGFISECLEFECVEVCCVVVSVASVVWEGYECVSRIISKGFGYVEELCCTVLL